MLTADEFSELQSTFARLTPDGMAPRLQDLLKVHADDARLWFLRGATCHRLGQIDEALSAFERTLELSPANRQALNAKAALLSELGRHRDALSILKSAQERFPEDPTLLANLGYVLEQDGDSLLQALDAYDAALRMDPVHRATLVNRGYLLCALGRPEDAVENNRRLVELAPTDAVAHFNLADSLLAVKSYEQAICACDTAIALDRTLSKAYINRALANIALGRLSEGERDLEYVRETAPDALTEFHSGFSKRAGDIFHRFDAHSLYLHLLYEWIAVCDWTRWDEFVDAVKDLALGSAGTSPAISDPNLPFRTLGFPVGQETSRVLAESVARGVAERASTLVSAPLVRKKGRQSKIRLGHVSPDFRVHPGGYLTRRMYGLHDRNRFEVFAYSLYPEDGSGVRQDIERGCDVFRDVSSLETQALVELLRADEIDIAIDLSGYTNFTRPEIFACRVAPVQTLYLGYARSMGPGLMDYALVDPVVCPVGTDSWWAEKLVRLPHSYFMTNNREAIDPGGLSRSALGLPGEGFAFCCFNNPYKIDPATFGVWMKLLARVDGSVLWIFKTKDTVEANLRKEAAARDIDPSRLVFAPFMRDHARHLGRYLYADLFLDTRYCNAHTTAIDALWCGVPVLTVPGETMASRVGASLLNAIGLPELICKDWADYEEKAVWLATHPDELAAIKRKLASNRDSYPLFDTEGQVRALESAYEEMWRRHQAGLPPESFNVKPLVNKDFRNAWH